MHAEELRAGHARWIEFPQVSERTMRTRFVLFCQEAGAAALDPVAAVHSFEQAGRYGSVRRKAISSVA